MQGAPSATRSAVAFAAKVAPLSARDAGAAGGANGGHAAALLAREPSKAVENAEERWVRAGDGVVDHLLVSAKEHGWRKVTVIGGGYVMEVAVAALLEAGVQVVVVGLGGGVTDVGGKVSGVVEVCALSAVPHAVGASDAVVFGGEVVCADGSVIVAKGVPVCVAVAKAAAVKCFAAVQTVKFGVDVYMESVGREGVEVLEGSFVDAFFTEKGRVDAVKTFSIAKMYPLV